MSKVIGAILPIAGAVLGSFIPGIGTAAGAALGGAVGGFAGSEISGGNPFLGAAAGGASGFIGGGGLGSLLGGAGNAAAPITEAGASGAISGAADPIEAISQAMSATGTSTATEAANALGYSSTANMLSAVNPSWVTPGAATGAVQTASGGITGAGGIGAPPTTIGGNATPAAAAQQRSLLNALTTGRSSALGPISSLMSIGSGIYGMSQASQMQDLAKQLAQSGGQYAPGYAAQLNALMKNPSSITSMPGYEAGMDAVTRSMAAQGYQGSGNMATALQKYGGDFFNNQVAQLQGLAQGGAQQTGAAISGLNMANQSASGALAALGYGAAGLGF